MSEIKLLKVLGEGGSSSVVYKAKWQNRMIAFKCFKTRDICAQQDSYDEFEKEVTILGSVSHPNILQFFGCSLRPPRVGILMEFCENGDLEVFLKLKIEVEKVGISFDEKLRLCNEVISAMIYLHSRSIIHRDIKLENVLLNRSETCKLMDFGLSKIVDRMSRQKTKNIGTSYYMAPELIESAGNYDEKVDSFAFGILMYIIFSENFFPYGRDAVNVEIRVAIDPNMRPDLKMLVGKVPNEHLKWICRIIQSLWDHSSRSRHAFKDLPSLIDDGLGGEKGKEDDNKRIGNVPIWKINTEEEETPNKEVSIPVEEYQRLLLVDKENEKLKKEIEELRKLTTKKGHGGDEEEEKQTFDDF